MLPRQLPLAASAPPRARGGRIRRCRTRGGWGLSAPTAGRLGSSLPLFPQAPAGPGGAHGGPWPGPGLSPSWSGLRPLPSPSVLPGPVWFPEKTCLQFSGETEAGVRPLARADAAAERPRREPRHSPVPRRPGWGASGLTSCLNFRSHLALMFRRGSWSGDPSRRPHDHASSALGRLGVPAWPVPCSEPSAALTALRWVRPLRSRAPSAGNLNLPACSPANR